jgi:hypothetical protein
MAGAAKHPADRRTQSRLLAVHADLHLAYSLHARTVALDGSAHRHDAAEDRAGGPSAVEDAIRLTEDHPFRSDCDLRTGLHRLGYKLNAVTSANPLAEDSRFSSFVDNLVSVGQFDDCLERVLAKLNVGRPQYLIINVCETHYPYYDGAYDPHFSPSRLHGFAAQMRAAAADQAVTIPTCDDALLSVLRLRQIESIRYLDSVIPKLFSRLPSDTYITITADHGDCFGEDGFVGHGEVWNKMVLEVPFLEGPVPS